MPGRNPRAASRIPLFLLPAAVVALAQPVFAAPPASTTPAATGGFARERVVAVEVDTAGTGGSIRTQPEFLAGGSDGRYRFGASCSAQLGAPVLTQMLVALQSGTPLTVITDASGSAKAPCVSKLVFYAH